MKYLNWKWILFFTAYILAFSSVLFGIQGICHELYLAQQEEMLCSDTKKVQTKAIQQKANVNSYNKKFTSQNTNQEEQYKLQKEQKELQEEIAQKILRFHVIANSDSNLDQSLKLMVRNEVIASLQNAMRNADSVKQAKAIAASRQEQIQRTAERTLQRQGCCATVTVTLSKRYFPIKQYGDLIFPAGTYDALCIEIGKAAGHNWWCVLFPSLCFVNETTATVPDASKEKLKDSLSEENYAYLQSGQPANNTQSDTKSPCPSPSQNTQDNTEVRFALADWFRAKTK